MNTIPAEVIIEIASFLHVKEFCLGLSFANKQIYEAIHSNEQLWQLKFAKDFNVSLAQLLKRNQKQRERNNNNNNRKSNVTTRGGNYWKQRYVERLSSEANKEFKSLLGHNPIDWDKILTVVERVPVPNFLNINRNNGDTMLELAITTNASVDTIRRLLTRFFEIQTARKETTSFEPQIINVVKSVREDKELLIEMLVAFGDDINARKGETALTAATRTYPQTIDYKLVTVLLNHGADPNLTDCFGNAPLLLLLKHLAGRSRLQSDEIDAVRLMLEKGATVKLDALMALLAGPENYSQEVIDLLFQYGLDLTAEPTTYNNKASLWPLIPSRFKEQLMDYLFTKATEQFASKENPPQLPGPADNSANNNNNNDNEKGTNAHGKKYFDYIPYGAQLFFMALEDQSHAKYSERIHLMIKHGADYRAYRTKTGETPLHVVARVLVNLFGTRTYGGRLEEFIKVMRIFITGGVDVTCQTHLRCETVLHILCRCPSSAATSYPKAFEHTLDLMKMIVDVCRSNNNNNNSNADEHAASKLLQAQDDLGRTALGVARSSCNDRFVAFLQSNIEDLEKEKAEAEAAAKKQEADKKDAKASAPARDEKDLRSPILRTSGVRLSCWSPTPNTPQ